MLVLNRWSEVNMDAIIMSVIQNLKDPVRLQCKRSAENGCTMGRTHTVQDVLTVELQ